VEQLHRRHRPGLTAVGRSTAPTTCVLLVHTEAVSFVGYGYPQPGDRGDLLPVWSCPCLLKDCRSQLSSPSRGPEHSGRAYGPGKAARAGQCRGRAAAVRTSLRFQGSTPNDASLPRRARLRSGYGAPTPGGWARRARGGGAAMNLQQLSEVQLGVSMLPLRNF
jgi:hypothetical protein